MSIVARTVTANQAIVSATQIRHLALVPSPPLAFHAHKTVLVPHNYVTHKAPATACRWAQCARLPLNAHFTMATSVRQS